MDQQLDDDFTLTEDTSTIEKKRPAFLLVLCILTFVSSGFGIIMGLVNYAGFNSVEKQFDNASIGNPMAEQMFSTLDVERIQAIQDWSTLLGIIASVLCLAGAIIMFKMRKIGFVPYVIGQAASIYGTYVGLSVLTEMRAVMPVAEMGDLMTMMGGVVIVFVAIFAVAFIIMYAVNLKHLK